jgi:hypothetical protein
MAQFLQICLKIFWASELKPKWFSVVGLFGKVSSKKGCSGSFVWRQNAKKKKKKKKSERQNKVRQEEEEEVEEVEQKWEACWEMPSDKNRRK